MTMAWSTCVFAETHSLIKGHQAWSAPLSTLPPHLHPPPLPALFYIPSASFHLHHLFLFTAAPPTFLMDFSDPPHLKMFLLCLPASKIWPASDGCLKICHCFPVSLIKTNEIGRHLGRHCRMTLLMYSIMLWWSGAGGWGWGGQGRGQTSSKYMAWSLESQLEFTVSAFALLQWQTHYFYLAHRQ